MQLENSRLSLSFNVLQDKRSAAVSGIWGTPTLLHSEKCIFWPVHESEVTGMEPLHPRFGWM